MKDATHTLKGITDLLLSPAQDYTSIRNACASLTGFFYEISGFDDSAKESQANIQTAAGLAISPTAAAFCIMDMMRTRNFLQGIKEAIDTRLKINPGKPVTVLYAGTGPFATLLTPLTTQFSPVQLKMVLLEINPVSIDYLNKLINRLELEPYIIDIVQTDASLYNIPDKHQPDIIISETLKPGLEKEPWVSIVANLLPQCRRDPILIPALIKVEACLAGNNADNGLSILPLKLLLEFSAETAMTLNQDKNRLPVFSSGLVVPVTEVPAGYYQLILSTFIRVFNQHELSINECGLTIPLKLMDTASLKKIPTSLLFRYELGSNPGFRVTEL